MARSGDYIIADRLNGAALPVTMWPLRLVGAAVPPHPCRSRRSPPIPRSSVPGTPTPTPTPGNTTPYKPLVIPGRIEAEDYNLGGEGVAYHDSTSGNEGGVYRHDDVDIENIASEGSNSVGWIRNGEWLGYTATVQQAGAYTLKARVASPYAGRTAVLSVDGTQAATIAVPNTGSFETFTTVTVPVTLTAGSHLLKLAFPGDGQNVNYLEFVSNSTHPNPDAGQHDAVANPLVIPGRIEAEDYNLGGEGVAYHDRPPATRAVSTATTTSTSRTSRRKDRTASAGSGAASGSRYTATVQHAGVYTLKARVASPYAGRTASLSVDGIQAATIAVPNTGSFETFTTVTVPVTLTAGSHLLKLAFRATART